SSVQPTISMAPSSGKQYDPLEELDALETPRTSAKSSTEMKKTTEKTADKKPANVGGSWFGGLFSKLAPKPKNQMILPDDSNPTIVWDPVAKKWMNKDEDGDGGAAALVPPPKTSDMSFRAPAMERSVAPSQPLPPSGEDAPTMDVVPTKLPTGNSNMFKLQKGRSMRANYVDVMNPGGGKPKTGPASSTPMTSPLVPMATSSPQLFIPTPINDSTAPVDFLTPAATPPSGNVAENTPQAVSLS
ncbi:protein transport protein sec16a, partial [Lasius niger]